MNNTNYNVTTEPYVEVKFKQTHPDAILPRRKNDDQLTGDVGFDLFAIKDTIIPASKSIKTDTGEQVVFIGNNIVEVGITVADITPGYWFRIEGRSGLGFSKGVQPLQGIIDQNYRGDLGIKLYNLTGQDVMIKKGQACAQFILYKMIPTVVEWSDQVTESVRGANGFGSSDAK